MTTKGFTQTYRCYNFVDKNPVIDRMRTILQEEGYFAKKRRQTLHELSGVATSTFEGWFEGSTRNPQHATIAATMAAIGYEEKFIKVRTLDEEKELIKAREWMEKQRDLRAKAKNGKANGRTPKRRGRRG